jgi:hypothetical protein
VIQDVIATGVLKDILFCMKVRITDHSSNVNDTVLVNKGVNLTEALEITRLCAKTSRPQLEGRSRQYLYFRDDWNAQSCSYDKFQVRLII